MRVYVEDFDVHMEFGNNGITMQVYEPDGKTHRGKLRIGKGTIEWCPGKTRVGNGHQKGWAKLIEWFESEK